MALVEGTRRRDRWADWAVILVLLIALALGFVLRQRTLYTTSEFVIDDGAITGRAPVRWLREFDANPLLRTRNPRGGAFNTTLELRTRPLAADAEPALALQALTLERADDTSAYRTLETSEVSLGARSALQRTFTYVQTAQNPYLDHLPVVVKGVDLVVEDEGRAVIATYLSSAETFDANYRYFRDFVQTLDF